MMIYFRSDAGCMDVEWLTDFDEYRLGGRDFSVESTIHQPSISTDMQTRKSRSLDPKDGNREQEIGD